jgi:DHH family putative phosphoesterase
MRYYDVFNGDADGLCALQQLRLADPIDSTLVTGLKRDIALLHAVPAADGDLVTVLDISLDRNRDALAALLERGAVVHYFDHHYAGDVPQHPQLLAVIDESRAMCTSALVDRYLGGRFRAWAVVGAFGDGQDDAAAELARTLPLDATELAQLRELGVNLNYGAYGQSAADVLVRPEDMFRIVSHYRDPLDLVREEPIIGRLGAERDADLGRALKGHVARTTPQADLWVLPDEAWARRVIGTFANRLATDEPHRAHAVLALRPDDACLVSVRSPPGRGPRAVDLCRRFPTGGGRAVAAGIDRLPPERLEEFVSAFESAWSGALAA